MDFNSGNGKSVQRVIDCHSVAHQKASKGAKACDGADVIDGLAHLQNLTLRLVAGAFGVSMTSLVTALNLTPAQRDDVRRGQRPLALPNTPKALPAPASPQAIGLVEQTKLSN